MNKIINCIKKNLSNIAWLSSLIIIVTIFLINKDNEYLESYSYIATIISLIFVAIQIFMYIREEKENNNRLRIEKSIELAAVYADQILKNISIISYVYNSLEITKIIDQAKPKDMNIFDVHEMEQIFSKGTIDEMEKILNSPELVANYFLLKSLTETDSSLQETSSPSKQFKNLSPINRQQLQMEFKDIVADTLNKLEYFSMYLVYEIADEETLYQSLHNSYRHVIKFLYFDISRQNKDGKNKFYTNVITLFNKWEDRYIEKCNLETDTKRGLLHMGQKAK